MYKTIPVINAWPTPNCALIDKFQHAKLSHDSGTIRMSGLFSRLSILLLLGACLSFGCSERKPDSLSALDVTDVVDLGTVPPEVASGSFSVRCVASGGSQVTDIKASCGCTTVASRLPIDIGVGNTETFDFSFDAKGMYGPVSKLITVFEQTNGAECRHEVVVRAYVDQSLRTTISPDSVDLGHFGNWEAQRCQARIRCVGRPLQNAVVSDALPKWLTVTTEKVNDNEYIIRSVVRRAGPSGRFRHMTVIHVDDEELSLLIEGHSHDRPFIASLTAVGRMNDGVWTFAIPLKHSPAEPLQISQVRLADQIIDGWVLEKLSQSQSTLHCTAKADTLVAGPVEVGLTLNTVGGPVSVHGTAFCVQPNITQASVMSSGLRLVKRRNASWVNAECFHGFNM